MADLAPGDIFPDITLPEHTGRELPLSEIADGQPLVVCFMRGWWCPKEQIRVRNLVRKAFVPKAVDRHRPLMRSILESLLAPVIERGRCEFMTEVAEHYPIQVMCEVLGVPSGDHEDAQSGEGRSPPNLEHT